MFLPLSTGTQPVPLLLCTNRTFSLCSDRRRGEVVSSLHPWYRSNFLPSLWNRERSVLVASNGIYTRDLAPIKLLFGITGLRFRASNKSINACSNYPIA